jgi:hypothetical protein
MSKKFDTILYEILKEKLKNTGRWTNQNNLDMYNEGEFWDNIIDFLNDELVTFSEIYIINTYYQIITEDKNYINVKNNYVLLNLLVDDILKNDIWYLTCEEIENNYSYGEL